MAYIAPNSTIEFFADMGMDSGYENTMYFEDWQTKDAYFGRLPKETFVENQSYTRTGRGVIKVQQPMSTMYKCGYMRYKNTSFEDKWFYAFINSVEYINNITTEVRFTIDVMTTWMGAFTLGACFVERQHTLTDNIGDNIVDEGIPCGELINEFLYPSGYMSGGQNTTWKICLTSTADPDTGADQQGGLYGGIYSGSGQFYYDADDPNDIAKLNQDLAYLTSQGKATGIVGLAIVPNFFLSQKDSHTTEATPWFWYKPYATVDGYTPNNNKLFIYPYKSLQVSNCEGNFAEFRYEFFHHENSGEGADPNIYEFEIFGVTGLQSEICCSPLDYKGLSNNINEKISMSEFPMCSYNIDPYFAYIAQNKGSMTANVISSIFSDASKAIMAGATGGASLALGTVAPQMSAESGIGGSTAKTIINTLGKLADYDRLPPQRGGAQGINALIGRANGYQSKDFYFIGKTITAEYAKIIDDYFTMFGYAINEVAIPNMNARPHYTYVQTQGCIVKGEMPADDCKAIENIFNKGVRFWNNINEIGNYTVIDNSPAQGGD